MFNLQTQLSEILTILRQKFHKLEHNLHSPLLVMEHNIIFWEPHNPTNYHPNEQPKVPAKLSSHTRTRSRLSVTEAAGVSIKHQAKRQHAFKSTQKTHKKRWCAVSATSRQIGHITCWMSWHTLLLASSVYHINCNSSKGLESNLKWFKLKS